MIKLRVQAEQAVTPRKTSQTPVSARRSRVDDKCSKAWRQISVNKINDAKAPFSAGETLQIFKPPYFCYIQIIFEVSQRLVSEFLPVFLKPAACPACTDR